MKEVVALVAAETRGLPDLNIQQAFIAAAPFHPAAVRLWQEYGKEIFKQTGRKMFGFNYDKKVRYTIL